MSFFFNSLRNFYVSGTTSANASTSMRTKKENPWKDSNAFPLGFYAKGLNVPSVLRKGIQYSDAEVEHKTTRLETSIAPTVIKSVIVNPSQAVMAYIDGNGFLQVVAGTIPMEGGAIDWGYEVELTVAATTSISLTKTPEGGFAISYRVGGVVFAQVGSVSIDNVITMGNAKDVTEGGVQCSNTGTSIVVPSAGYLVVLFTRADDGAGYAVGMSYAADIIGSLGTAAKYEDTANIPAACVFSPNSILVAYQDSGATDDPITTCVLSFDTDDMSITPAVPVSMVGTAGTATAVNAVSSGNNTLVIGWIDNTDPHMRAATADGLELTWGTELSLTTDNAAYLSLDVLDDNEFIAAWENTGQSNYLFTTTVTLSGTTLAAQSYLDPAVEAESIYVNVLALNKRHIVLFFADAANSNYFTEQYGVVKTNLVEIRSTTASVVFQGYITSLGQDGLGAMGCKKITGTTHATADTAMATKPTNPFANTNDPNNVVVFFTDTRLYVEDDGTVKPKKSGVASGTIDVRSTTTATAFTAYVMKILNPIQSMEVA